MNSNLLFDFSIDKENESIHVTREFAADLNTVWQAWTTAELLDQWWAPQPYKAETKSMDFTEGGSWLYAMVGPGGDTDKHWCRADYKSITPQDRFSYLDAFCDANGNVNENMPRTLWSNHFNGSGDKTTVNIMLKYNSLEDLEKVISFGMKEGFSMALNNLDQLLITIKNK